MSLFLIGHFPTKNALHLRLHVFHPNHAKVQLLAAQMQYLDYFLDPEYWSDPKDQTRDLALCSQALYQLFELVLPAVYCSSDQNTSPQTFVNPFRKVLPVLRRSRQEFDRGFVKANLR